ncbi:MAG: response regulator, partial [Gemmatimonadetes bacterium]|nr:response regulator [Gemmatimonadota bacterium]
MTAPVVQALICEDEPLARRALRTYLQDVSWLEVVAEAATGPEAMRMIHKHEPELVFMDVRLPGVSGLEVLDAIHHQPAIVFTTAFDEYALPAFELGAVDYLLKPFGKARLLETLDRVRVRLLGEGLLPAPTGGGSRPRRPASGRVFARARGALV